MKKNTLNNVLLGVFSIAMCFLLAEGAIRFMGKTDIDNNFTFSWRWLKPFHLPRNFYKSWLHDYNTSYSRIVSYDPLTGWSPDPNLLSLDGFSKHNSLGIRSAATEYPFIPNEGKLRIALFGDSFTYGADIKYDNTWAVYLEKELKAYGIDAEILNFGVVGYGIDQAYLRWKHLGYKFSPDIVILGFQAENTKRNINLMRMFYQPGGISFSKPRFILENENLKLINSPTASPADLFQILENIENWELLKYESFYDPDDYRTPFWLKSKLVSLILNISSLNRYNYLEKEGSFYALDQEPARLTLKIIEEFQKSVKDTGAEFLIVHLPIKLDIENLIRGYEHPYSELLKEISKTYPTIHTSNRIYEISKDSSIKRLFINHYNPNGNKLIARIVADYLIDLRAKEYHGR